LAICKHWKSEIEAKSASAVRTFRLTNYDLFQVLTKLTVLTEYPMPLIGQPPAIISFTFHAVTEIASAMRLYLEIATMLTDSRLAG
jgi:hypothetical protein